MFSPAVWGTLRKNDSSESQRKPCRKHTHRRQLESQCRSNFCGQSGPPRGTPTQYTELGPFRGDVEPTLRCSGISLVVPNNRLADVMPARPPQRQIGSAEGGEVGRAGDRVR